jgi:hypothetical protein
VTLLTLWPTIVDDSGTKTDGTTLDKALFDEIKAAIEDQVHSTVNTTVKPKTITDEVIAGRGGQASLDARFDAIDVLTTNGMRRLSTDHAVANVGAGETVLSTYTLAAGLLATNGQAVEFTPLASPPTTRTPRHCGCTSAPPCYRSP